MVRFFGGSNYCFQGKEQTFTVKVIDITVNLSLLQCLRFDQWDRSPSFQKHRPLKTLKVEPLNVFSEATDDMKKWNYACNDNLRCGVYENNSWISAMAKQKWGQSKHNPVGLWLDSTEVFHVVSISAHRVSMTSSMTAFLPPRWGLLARKHLNPAWWLNQVWATALSAQRLEFIKSRLV